MWMGSESKSIQWSISKREVTKRYVDIVDSIVDPIAQTSD